jgi:DNA polymerase-1
MEKIYILDASGYLYSSYFAIRNMTNRKGESTNALFGFVRSVLKLIKDFHPDHLVAVFDGPHNAKRREEIYSDYKAHRSATPQDLPYQINWAVEFCSLIGIPHLNIPEVEADDTMGSVAVWAEKQNAHAFLCTVDKDMCQLVSKNISMLNTRKENLLCGPTEVQELYGVPPSQMHDLLALIGDTSDNVPGVPGIGPKTAAALLNQYGSLEAILHNSQTGNKKQALIQENAEKARLSYKLVALDLQVPIPHTAAFYQIKPPDLPQLIEFYLQMGFQSLVKELQKEPELPLFATAAEKKEGPAVVGDYLLVDEEEALHALVALLRKQKEIGLAIQADGESPFTSEPMGVALALKPGQAWYIPLNGALGCTRALQILKPLFEDPHVGFYGHNIKFCMHLLSQKQIALSCIVFDTMLASYLLNAHNRQNSLESLSLEYLGEVKPALEELLGKGKGALTIGKVPLDKMCLFCCEEANTICQLKQLLEKQLKERGLEKLFDQLELPLISVLAKMEQHGIFIDTDYLQKMSHAVQGKIDRVKDKIYQAAGEEFNLNSPKQLSAILQDKLHITLPKKTATGFSTNAEILEELKSSYPIAEDLLEYRTLEKLRTTYIENLPHQVNSKTHRIHCTFNQSVAATGRLSCQDPNLQNIPIRTEIGRAIREAFKPQKEGWVPTIPRWSCAFLLTSAKIRN